MVNSTEEVLMKLKVNLCKEKEFYLSILELANTFNSNSGFLPMDFLNYLSKRMDIEDKINEIEDIIRDEKIFWIENKSVIKESELKRELSDILKELKDIIEKIVKIDGEIANNMKTKGISINNSYVKAVNVKNVINIYKKNK